MRTGVIKLINEEINGLVYCKPKKPHQIAEKITIAINSTGLNTLEYKIISKETINENVEIIKVNI